MKRLHSCFTYPYVLFPLLVDPVITNAILTKYDNFSNSYKLLVIVLVINVVFLSAFASLFSSLKRVYIDGSVVYTYNLYSKNPYAIELDEIVNFERDNSDHAVLLGIYKITVAVDGQHQTFEFMKNKLIWNVRKYFE